MSWSIFVFISPMSRDKHLIDMIKISDLLDLLINDQWIYALYKNFVFY